MIDFKPITIDQKDLYSPYLRCGSHRGCAYSFVNLFLWGRQKAALVEGQLVVFSQYDRKSVYLFPAGCGDRSKALSAITEDAAQRGIPCRLVGLSQDDCALLEQLYPGRLRCRFDRDAFDYVYPIEKMATFSGKKLQKKRNHLNRFRAENPEHRFQEITDENIGVVEALAEKWYRLRMEADPHSDFVLEQAAMKKALAYRKELDLEGLILYTKEGAVAMTLGSFLNAETFDVHFEKALDAVDGSYPAITNGFARHLAEKYPGLRYLNREDDMGLEGLRKAKLSYYPEHMVEKYWAHLTEDGYDY